MEYEFAWCVPSLCTREAEARERSEGTRPIVVDLTGTVYAMEAITDHKVQSVFRAGPFVKKHYIQ